MPISSKFGKYGGQYVPEPLMQPLHDLEEAFEKYCNQPDFLEEFNYYMRDFVHRPSPLYLAANLTKKLGGATIYLKREDLNHTGAHKINNVIGQILIAKRMGKTKIIAETGAGQHGVATATGAALFGMQCIIYMGAEDIKRQKLNVFRMKLLGAEVVSVKSGSQTLKDAVNEAISQWVQNISDTFYILGSAVGPHPYPTIVKHFQKIIGEEARAQILEKIGRLPDALVACVGGGSNAIGLYHAFLDDKDVAIYGVEGAGKGIKTGEHAVAFAGSEGVVHGMRTFLMQTKEGYIAEAYSISAGLDYPGVGPEHAHLRDINRAKYTSVDDQEALEGFSLLCKTEGIIPALESAHAIAYVMKLAPTMSKDSVIIVNLSGRGDKDMHSVAPYFDADKID